MSRKVANAMKRTASPRPRDGGQDKADMTFGGRVRIQMAAAGIKSAAELSRRMGLGRQTISKWLNDEIKDIGLENLYRLSDVLNCSARWLATRTGTPSRATRMSVEEREALDLYRTLAEPVRDSWISSGRALLKASTAPSPSQPFKLKQQ
jgi:transcriptional regulator with XRE-family HTH domain